MGHSTSAARRRRRGGRRPRAGRGLRGVPRGRRGGRRRRRAGRRTDAGRARRRVAAPRRAEGNVLEIDGGAEFLDARQAEQRPVRRHLAEPPRRKSPPPPRGDPDLRRQPRSRPEAVRLRVVARSPSSHPTRPAASRRRRLIDGGAAARGSTSWTCWTRATAGSWFVRTEKEKAPCVVIKAAAAGSRLRRRRRRRRLNAPGPAARRRRRGGAARRPRSRAVAHRAGLEPPSPWRRRGAAALRAGHGLAGRRRGGDRCGRQYKHFAAAGFARVAVGAGPHSC